MGQIQYSEKYFDDTHEYRFQGMHSQNKDQIGNLLKGLPPVEFCCVYGSTLHPNNNDKAKMVDYILGVLDPLQWHTEVTQVADKVGVGVHFNPFVTYNDGLFKYGVVRMNDLVDDILQWRRFYLSGRLQKPVRIVVDNLDIRNLNSINLRAAVSAALLLLPAKFTEADLYATICSLSYMGDVRMLFAEDRNKVKNIVTGQFDLFKTMYKQTLADCEAKDILKLASPNCPSASISQNCNVAAAQTLVSFLPSRIKSEMMGDDKRLIPTGQAVQEIVINTREEAAKRMTKVLRCTVMVSSARQAVSGLLSVGGVNAARYLSSKMCKAWKSWT